MLKGESDQFEKVLCHERFGSTQAGGAKAPPQDLQETSKNHPNNVDHSREIQSIGFLEAPYWYSTISPVTIAVAGA